jgi:ABC-type Na+ transport system ATPase subunit NatA
MNNKRKSNNNVSSSKRSKKNGRRVTFKNSVNVKNLNIEENAREYRRPIGINKRNRNELPTYMTNHSVLKNKINRINHHKKTTLKTMKNT